MDTVIKLKRICQWQYAGITAATEAHFIYSINIYHEANVFSVTDTFMF